MSESDKLRPLIDVGRGKLPGEIDWWFLSPEHVDGFADEIVEAKSLGHRVSLMFIACQWHAEQNKALPQPLVDALASVLALGREIAEQSLNGLMLNQTEIERAANNITASCKASTARRLSTGERRRRSLEAQPLELREALYRLARYCSEQGQPTPAPVLVSLQHMLGLVRPKTGLPLPSAEILALTGLPNVDDLATFLEAAKEDGKALQPHHTPDLDLDGFESLADDIHQKVDAREWALSPQVVADRVGSSRTTIRDWRKLPQYLRFAKAAASMPSLTTAVWNRWRQSDPE